MKKKLFMYVAFISLFSQFYSCSTEEVTITFLQHDQYYEEVNSNYYFTNKIVCTSIIKRPKGYKFSKEEFNKLYNQGQGSEVDFIVFGAGYGYYSFSPFFKCYDSTTGLASDEFSNGKISNNMTLHFVVKG